MIELRRFDGLGHADHGWLDARHHFSFAEYYDPERMGVGPLRVWNDDTIAPGSGFPMHPHRDMEIITYVRDGAITHQDHLGNRGRTPAGDVQVMTAGKGILHAEYNTEDVNTRIFQIWIQPNRSGLPPRWEQRAFPKADRAGQLVALASGRPGDLTDGALPINQDAALYGATLAAGQALDYRFDAGRQGYLVVAKGAVTANDIRLDARDGAVITDTDHLRLNAEADSEILLVDLP